MGIGDSPGGRLIPGVHRGVVDSFAGRAGNRVGRCFICGLSISFSVLATGKAIDRTSSGIGGCTPVESAEEAEEDRRRGVQSAARVRAAA